MKIRHKFYILLSFKFNIRVFDRFENKFAEQILSLQPKDPATMPTIMYRFVVYRRRGSKPNLFNEIQTLLQVLKSRGQLRTLLLIDNPFSKTEEFYELSRLNLLIRILQNYESFRSNFLSKLSLEYLDFEIYSSFDSYPVTQINNKYTIRKFQNFSSFVMENKYTKSYKIKILQRGASEISLVGDFILWNSSLFIKFIREHNLTDYFSACWGANYKLILENLKKTRVIQVLDHQMSNSTFDEIYEKNGLNYYITIPNAEIWHQRFIFAQNTMINIDATSSPSLSFVAGNWPFIWKCKHRSSKYEIVTPSNSPLKIENAIYLIGRVDENWYHFLLDTAPRMLFLDNVPMSVPVLIRSDIPQTSKDFLRILTSREVIEIDPADFIEVEMLYVLPGKSTIFDSRPPKGLSQAEFSPLILSLFRNKVLKNLQISSNRNVKQRISFSRKSVIRNVINWGKVRQVLESFSVDDIPLDSKFFRSQVQVFSNSNFVVSPGGAVLANTIFMNPGSKVVALKSFRGQRVDLWRKLSDSLDLKYNAVNGIPTYWGFFYLRKLHSNYYISPRKLRRILSREI